MKRAIESRWDQRGRMGVIGKPARRCHGMGLGIILLEEVFPGFPGDMRNASAYPFPIQYAIAEGVDNEALLFAEDKSPCLEPIRRAARQLEEMGCRAIAAECGYFAYFQKQIAGYVGVPVFMSSLLQVPWAQRLVGAEHTVGVLVAFEKYLTPAHLEAVGIDLESNYVLHGASESGRCSELQTMCGSERIADRAASYERMEQQLVDTALDFRHRHPEMKALVVECSAMQPFGRALQRQLDLPVFSWGTLLDHAYSIVVHTPFEEPRDPNRRV